jgi:hypothetical protein
MTTFDEEKRQFIFDEVFDKFILLAKNTNGLCVIKKLIQIYSPLPASLIAGDKSKEFCGKKEENSKKLFALIHDNVIDLVQDPFGNYSVTEIIQVNL